MEFNLDYEAITKKMQSLLTREEALVRLFNYASTSFQHLLLCLFTFAIFLVTFFTFIGRFPLIQRDQEYEYVFSDDEEEQQEPHQEGYSCVDSTKRVKDHLAADTTTRGRGTLLFQHPQKPHSHYSEEFTSPRESLVEESEENHSSETLSVHKSPQVSDFETEATEQEFPPTNSVLIENKTTSHTTLNLYKDEHVSVGGGTTKNKKVKEENLITRDERFFVFAPTELHSKKLIVEEKDVDGGESCYDDGSTISKGSSEWRSSIHFKDYETDGEDQFSSSSRTSCPKWESHTLFQKYDEEMSFLDRISAQKLHETESLRSIQASPRSISERIASKFSSVNKTPAADTGHNPYRELEGAYVAQICLTWEALNWNYRNFQSKHGSSRHDPDTGCPASVAQQFQQFQVLLQRYIENEPYEHGRRPEIYARMRLLAPKLLLVPQYRDSEENEKDGGLQSKISSASFLIIMEDGIRTFMKFLKADKEKPCQILATYFRRNRRCIVDPTLLRLMKKVNQKKRTKVKDLQNSRKCLRKRRAKEEEGMDILMAKIDLKVVARVLRMNELNEAQLNWCEEKMSKVRIMAGRLHTDYSTPLFFPSH